MIRKFALLFILVSLLAGAVAPALAQAQFAIPHLDVNTSFLNIRSGDGPQFSVIGTVVGGTELNVLGMNDSGSWFLVSSPFGNGWVDVSFTLPRGDFTNVPTIEQAAGAQVVVQTPVTIGLPGSATAFNAAPLVTVPSATRITINVISVNLRTQPADNAPVIGIIFKGMFNDFAVVGYGGDNRGVPWVAIVVPGMGTGWVELPKTSAVLPVAGVGTTSGGSTTIPVASLDVPHVVVNTSYQNIRRGAGPQFAVLTVVPGGTELNVIGRTEATTWYLVTGDFGQGWISSEFVLFRGTFFNVPILYSPE